MWRRGSTVPRDRHAWEAQEELPGVRTRGKSGSAWAEQCSWTHLGSPQVTLGTEMSLKVMGWGGDRRERLSEKGRCRKTEKQTEGDAGERWRQTEIRRDRETQI